MTGELSQSCELLAVLNWSERKASVGDVLDRAGAGNVDESFRVTCALF